MVPVIDNATPKGQACLCSREYMYSTPAVLMQVLLPVMIYTAGPISGAHFNPMVTSVFMMARMQVLLLTTLTAPHFFLHPHAAHVSNLSQHSSTQTD